ncbi:MAG: hypothetical protein P8P98_02680, partial [Emcibacteraceae bacterium]|nr:hypothetical protein [Emcibacteraceae bacterium]
MNDCIRPKADVKYRYQYQAKTAIRKCWDKKNYNNNRIEVSVAIHFKLFLVALGFTQLMPAQNSLADEPVLICGEPWAPFLYETDDDGQGDKKITGLHPENFHLIGKLTGLEFVFETLPWKRCLLNVENYSKSGDYEIAIDAAFSKGRAEKYHYVGPLYSLKSAVYYSRNKFPNGLFTKDTGEMISKFASLKPFKMCSFLGWGFGNLL